jgi:general secretion pathway protein G
MKAFIAMALLLAGALVARAYEPAYLATERQMFALEVGCNMYVLNLGHYPSAAEGLSALTNRPANMPTNKWAGPFIQETYQDTWGHDFIYVYPGIHNTNGFDLYSLGRDGISKSGGSDADDINNWDASKRWREYYLSNVTRSHQLTGLMQLGAILIIFAFCVYGSLRIMSRLPDGDKTT